MAAGCRGWVGRRRPRHLLDRGQSVVRGAHEQWRQEDYRLPNTAEEHPEDAWALELESEGDAEPAPVQREPHAGAAVEARWSDPGQPPSREPAASVHLGAPATSPNCYDHSATEHAAGPEAGSQEEQDAWPESTPPLATLEDEDWVPLPEAEGDADAGIPVAADEEALADDVALQDLLREEPDWEDRVGGIGAWDENEFDLAADAFFDESVPSPEEWEGDDPVVDEFDPNAQRRIWRRTEKDPALAKARGKAASIVSLLDVPRAADREAMLLLLAQLFRRLPHPRTYHAIEALADEGIAADTLRDAIALRRTWQERRDWWVGRYGWGYAAGPLRSGASALSWRLAARICRTRADHPPETMIDPDWLDEWWQLTPLDEGFYSFPAFLAVKVGGLAGERLFAGLVVEARDGTLDEISDALDWHRRLPRLQPFANVIREGPVPLFNRPPNGGGAAE